MDDWMGRYRPLISALVRHVNTVSKSNQMLHIYEDIYLTPNEWQALEYIVRNQDTDMNMNDIIRSLAIPQSSFSRIQKKLAGMGLVQRFQTEDNRKNILLKPTELALRAHQYHTGEMNRKMFQPFFDLLEAFSDEDIRQYTHALEILTDGAQKDEIEKRPILVPLD